MENVVPKLFTSLIPATTPFTTLLTPLSPPPPPAHAHVHTEGRAHAHTHAHTFTHTYMHSRTRTDTHTQTHTHTYMHSRTRTDTHTQTHTHTYAHTRARAHTHIKEQNSNLHNSNRFHQRTMTTTKQMQWRQCHTTWVTSPHDYSWKWSIVCLSRYGLPGSFNFISLRLVQWKKKEKKRRVPATVTHIFTRDLMNCMCFELIYPSRVTGL